MTAVLRRLTEVGPHAGAHRVALRAAVSVAVPLLVLLAIGHLPWSIYAVFGAFTSLYGRDRVDRHRLALQALAGALQVVLVTLGVVVALSAERAWWSIPVAAVVATLTAYVSSRQGWHPPGSLFQVFAFAAVASVPATSGDVLPAFVTSGCGALFALVVGNAGALWRRVRRPADVRPEAPIGGASEGVWRYALQAGVGVAIAGSIATAAGIGRPYWAMVGAVVPLVARALPMQIVRGLHRVIGTGVGLLVAWLLLELEPTGLAAVVIVVVLQAGAELLVGRNYALALVCVTPLALMMVHMVAPVPIGDLLAERGLETLIGVAIGLVVGYLSRPRPAVAGVAR